MSQFVVATTKVSDPNVIIAALEEMGIDRNHIEIHDIPAEMVGYDSRDVRVAEIIVRREHVGATYGDVGATRFDEDGKKGKYFRFIVDDMDCGKADDNGTCYGHVDRRLGTQAGGFANHLAARAGAIKAERVMRKRGFRTKRTYRKNAHGHVDQISVVAS